MVSEKRSPIHGVVMGATDRSYLMRDNQVGGLAVRRVPGRACRAVAARQWRRRCLAGRRWPCGALQLPALVCTPAPCWLAVASVHLPACLPACFLACPPRPPQIDVMRNVMGGVEDTGLSFKLTPPPGALGGGAAATPTLTPPKALLMNQARGAGGGAPTAPPARAAGVAGGLESWDGDHAMASLAPTRPSMHAPLPCTCLSRSAR